MAKKTDVDVLLSWSRPRSRAVATKLHEWLPLVLPGAKPWMSSKDISKGKEWFPELQAQLGSLRVCILCVTKENAKSPWLYYEAGAIAAKLDENVRILPYLIDLSADDLAGTPLSQWQCTISDKDDTFELIKSVNSLLGSAHHPEVLRGHYDSKWTTFEEVLTRLKATPDTSPDVVEVKPDFSLEQRKTLLASASTSPPYVIARIDPPGTLEVKIGQKVLFAGSDLNEVARWEAGIRNLDHNGFLRRMDNMKFDLTQKGYQAAETIRFEGVRNGTALAQVKQPVRELLIEAVKDRNGWIEVRDGMNESSVKTNGKDFCEGGMRDWILFTSGIRQMVSLGLIRPIGSDGNHELTEDGFDAAAAYSKES